MPGNGQQGLQARRTPRNTCREDAQGSESPGQWTPALRRAGARGQRGRHPTRQKTKPRASEHQNHAQDQNPAPSAIPSAQPQVSTATELFNCLSDLYSRDQLFPTQVLQVCFLHRICVSAIEDALKYSFRSQKTSSVEVSTPLPHRFSKSVQSHFSQFPWPHTILLTRHKTLRPQIALGRTGMPCRPPFSA